MKRVRPSKEVSVMHKEKEIENLEKAFRLMRGVLARPKWLVLLFLVSAFLFSATDALAAGIISTTFDAAGDIIAVPFKLVGGLFQAIF